MSKLIERIEKSARGAVQTMGFGPLASRPKPSGILTIAFLDKDSPKAAAAAAKAGADALVLPTTPANAQEVGATLKGLGNAIGGVLSQGLAMEHIQALKETGCDFLVFEPQNAPLALLRDEDMGKVLLLPDLATDDSVAATVEQLNIDALLLDLGEPPLTVQRLMAFQRLAGLTSKPVLAFVPPDLTTAEIEVLRDAGVQGLVLHVKDARAAERLPELRRIAEGLPPARKKKKKTKADALLPHISPRTALRREDEEEEEEEE